MIKNCILDKKVMEELQKENNTQFFPSKFNFLNSHKGLRRSCLHLLVGTSGSGKSSLAREIMIDTAKTAKVLTWISEESTQAYSLLLNEACPHDEIKKNIFVCSELDAPREAFKSIEHFVSNLKQLLVYTEAEVLFIDNLTTSFLYGDAVRVQGQTETTTRLREMADEFRIPIFLIAHTQKGVFDNNNHLISTGDVKGSSSISLTAPYAYALQSFKHNDQQTTVLKAEKSRNHKGCSNRFYKLFFEDGFYIADIEIKFDAVNDLFKERNRLKD